MTEPLPSFTVPDGALGGADWVHVDHVGYLAVPGTAARASVDGGVPIADFDLDRVELYAPSDEL